MELKMKIFKIYYIALILSFSNILVFAQGQVEISGEQTLGIRNLNLDVNSSKFNQYRDIRDGFFVPDMKLNLMNSQNSWFMSVSGANLLLDDQFIRVQLSDIGNRWNLYFVNNKTPHRFSNKAQTPFFMQANGLFTVPERVRIISDGDTATGTPSLVPTRGQMAINDSLVAHYLQSYLHPVNLNVQRELLAATLSLPRLGALSLNLTYADERRNGNRITFGPIGDRPPRTLNVQLPEPVQYVTREVHADAEYVMAGFQARLNYMMSIFENRIDHMTWENIFFRPVGGADFISAVAGTPRNVSSFGRRSLAPDNFYQNVSLSVGLNLPFDSRLTSSVALGYMNQDEQLLPYAFSALGGDISPAGDGVSWNDPAKLPRRSADAKIRTMRFDVDYTINLISRLNLRPFVRYYDLNNETPMSQWRYVTQDVAGTDGSVSYVNHRRNLAYSYNKFNYGVDARYYLTFWRSTFNLNYTRENLDREYREANTEENIYEARLRFRPLNLLSFSVSYLYGDRKGDTYNYNVTSNSYWYPFEMGANQVDNPQFLFANHPDLRKFDVSDRKRTQISLSAGLALLNNLDLTASFRNRNYDYDSDVSAVAPFAGTAVPLPNPADQFAMTPGQQLGLLKEVGQNISINANYSASERLNFMIFADREDINSDIRGHVFNENQRREPSHPANQPPNALGPWTDPNRLYNSETVQQTNTIGMGFSYELIPGRLRFLSDYSLSMTKIDLNYSGYGSDPAFLGVNWETFDFGFNDPETVNYDFYILNASLEYRLFEQFSVGLHYMFSRYFIQDWVEGAEGPWVEQVGSEFFLRDTSRDNRWGNRLVNMGLYLAPGYVAHVGFVTMTYHF
jgi:MtrB/PioB family decaheme-associated outer membrane protein